MNNTNNYTKTSEQSFSAALTSLAQSETLQPKTARERDCLFVEFRPLVQRLIRKYGDNTERRKDLEGEIFCLFCELLDAFDPARGVPLRAYLVHQLTTSTYTLARRNWRTDRREITVDQHEETPTETDPSDRWDDEILLQQVRKELPAAIAALPQRQRQVLVWRYYDHRSFEEIADSLDVQVATTRSLLRHGMNSLRKAFEKTDYVL
jgi:RNA polymerase sigma factor (sigma-70 family)